MVYEKLSSKFHYGTVKPETIKGDIDIEYARKLSEEAWWNLSQWDNSRSWGTRADGTIITGPDPEVDETIRANIEMWKTRFASIDPRFNGQTRIDYVEDGSDQWPAQFKADIIALNTELLNRKTAADEKSSQSLG